MSTKTKWLGFPAWDLPGLLLPSALGRLVLTRGSPPCAPGSGRAALALPCAQRGPQRISAPRSALLCGIRAARPGKAAAAGHWQGSPARSPCTATCLGPLGLIYVVRSGGRQWTGRGRSPPPSAIKLFDVRSANCRAPLLGLAAPPHP